MSVNTGALIGYPLGVYPVVLVLAARVNFVPQTGTHSVSHLESQCLGTR